MVEEEIIDVWHFTPLVEKMEEETEVETMEDETRIDVWYTEVVKNLEEDENGGGGSYYNGTLISGVNGDNQSHGSVTITKQ